MNIVVTMAEIEEASCCLSKPSENKAHASNGARSEQVTVGKKGKAVVGGCDETNEK